MTLAIPALLTLMAFGARAEEKAPLTVTEANAGTFYRDYIRLTEKPHYLPRAFATLCRLPPPASVEQQRRALGPHFETYVHVYVNPIAEKQMKPGGKGSVVFPEGAVIVKEKLSGEGKSVGIGGMIKRAAGYDARNADWEYFYLDPERGFTTGRLSNCANCHHEAKTTDFVFNVFKDWKAPIRP
jgi:hypothetical protein